MIGYRIEIHGETEAVVIAMMEATGQDMQTLLRKALSLYTIALEADTAGKVLGIAATEDGPVETVLTGFR